jgi:hypothetical protein
LKKWIIILLVVILLLLLYTIPRMEAGLTGSHTWELG